MSKSNTTDSDKWASLCEAFARDIARCEHQLATLSDLTEEERVDLRGYIAGLKTGEWYAMQGAGRI